MFARLAGRHALCTTRKLSTRFLSGVMISVEGNIGSGKTTIMQELLKSRGDVQIATEPVEKWRNIAGQNTLDLMYKDPKRWSYLFQSYVLLTMLENHCMSSKASVTLLERSAYSAMFCFVENLHLSGNLSDLEYAIHHRWFQWVEKYQIPKLDLIVYLRTSPQVCFERVKQRNRFEESGVTLDFVNQLHERHEDWLIRESKFMLPAPVVVIDANGSIADVLESCTRDVDPLFQLKI